MKYFYADVQQVSVVNGLGSLNINIEKRNVMSYDMSPIKRQTSYGDVTWSVFNDNRGLLQEFLKSKHSVALYGLTSMITEGDVIRVVFNNSTL